jgi:hypothetical protein
MQVYNGGAGEIRRAKRIRLAPDHGRRYRCGDSSSVVPLLFRGMASVLQLYKHDQMSFTGTDRQTDSRIDGQRETDRPGPARSISRWAMCYQRITAKDCQCEIAIQRSRWRLLEPPGQSQTWVSGRHWRLFHASCCALRAARICCSTRATSEA